MLRTCHSAISMVYGKIGPMPVSPRRPQTPEEPGLACIVYSFTPALGSGAEWELS